MMSHYSLQQSFSGPPRLQDQILPFGLTIYCIQDIFLFYVCCVFISQSEDKVREAIEPLSKAINLLLKLRR